jgi:hypothetical protein
MKTSLSCAVAVLLTVVATSFAGPEKAAIMANEKAAWQAYKDKKADDFKKVVDKDIKCVYADGVSDMAKELSDMKKWDIKSFEFSDFSMFSDEKDIAVTTYTVKLDATNEGKDMSGSYNAGSVWKLENGKWLAIFHTNVKAEAAK